MRSFFVQILTGPWLTFFGALLIASAAGSTYMFGLYSGDIKDALGYDQTTLNLIGFFKDLGSNFGIIAGLIGEATPTWFVLSVGAVLNFLSYLMIWLAVTKKIAKPTVWQMCLYMCVGANSQTFAFNGALVASVRNFKQGRGIMLGLLTGYAGLSGAIMTQLYHTIYTNNSKHSILLIGWLPTVISVAFARIVRVVKVTRQSNELKVFYKFLYISLALAGFLMVIIIVEKKLSFSRGEYGGVAAVILILLFLPLAIVISEELKILEAKRNILIDASPIKVTGDDENSTLAPKGLNGHCTDGVVGKTPL